jgi:pimeloyl-ACP methyl ester carboxylesterase
MSAITIGKDLVHYEVLGRGRPVIFLHGWIGSWRYWIPIMRQMQMKHRVYAIDLFGFGDSSKNPEKYPISKQMELLDEFLKQMGIPKVAFITHGLGAHVAIEFARQYPERIARLLLISAPLFDPGNLTNRVSLTPQIEYASSTPAPNKSTEREQLHQEALERGIAALRDENDLPNLNQSSNMNNPLRAILAEDMEHLLSRCFKRSETIYGRLRDDIAKADNTAVLESVKGFDAGEMLDAIRSFKIPTVIVHGTEDPLIPLPSDEIWDYLTTNNEKYLLPVPLPGVRHFPMIEHEPFQRLAGLFLGTPDVSRIEVKHRWRRRSR